MKAKIGMYSIPQRILSLLMGLVLLTTCFTILTPSAYALQVHLNKYYFIASALDENMVVDVSGGGHADGTNIQLYEKNGSDAQLFKLEKSEVDGYYYIVNKGSGKVLDVAGGGTASQTNVQLYTKNGTQAQHWKPYLAYNSSTNVSFMAQCGKFLDVSGGNTANGTNLWIYDGNDSLAQAFHLIPADGVDSTIQYVVTSNPSNRLNLRSDASTNSAIIGKLAYGTPVSVLNSSNGWAKVQVNSMTGYVSTQYLSSTAPSSGSGPVSGSSTEQQIYDRLQAMANGNYGGSAYRIGTRYTGQFASEQCKGFAKKVHMLLFGYNIGSTQSNNYQINITTANTRLVGTLTDLFSQSNSAVYNLFAAARPGDFVQVRRSHGGPHSMIFLSSDSKGVTVYESNVDGNNGIQIATYGWDEFRSDNSKVSVYTALDYTLH